MTTKHRPFLVLTCLAVFALLVPAEANAGLFDKLCKRKKKCCPPPTCCPAPVTEAAAPVVQAPVAITVPVERTTVVTGTVCFLLMGQQMEMVGPPISEGADCGAKLVESCAQAENGLKAAYPNMVDIIGCGCYEHEGCPATFDCPTDPCGGMVAAAKSAVPNAAAPCRYQVKWRGSCCGGGCVEGPTIIGADKCQVIAVAKKLFCLNAAAEGCRVVRCCYTCKLVP